ncbi:MAG: Bug family tripartite tricarboxylate transporter substrate binding protein [Burkholderiales bacterium]
MHRLIASVAVLACICCDVYAQREAYPVKPVRVVNPFTPGGAVDTVARIVVQQLNESWGQPVIIDNRPGAGTTIGTEIVTRAAPDGYTLLLTNGSIATNVTIYKNLSFHPAKDLPSRPSFRLQRTAKCARLRSAAQNASSLRPSCRL